MKHRLTFSIAIVALAFVACDNRKKGDMTPDQRFDGYRDRFIEDLWRLEPVWASMVGYHAHDTVLPLPGPERTDQQLRFCLSHLDSLASFKEEELGKSQRLDLRMMRDHLKATIWGIQTFKEHEWNPSVFNVANAMDAVINSTHAPLEDRLVALRGRLRSVRQYYANARMLIKDPTREHTELAIQQSRGTLDLLGPWLTDTIASCALTDSVKKLIDTDLDSARKGIEGYISFLENDWLPRLQTKARSPRIGKALFAEKFGHDINSIHHAQEVFDMAIAAKTQLHQRMDSLTRQLWPKHMGKMAMPADSLVAIRMLIDTLSHVHAQPDSFLQAIERQIPELTRFVTEKDLLTLDPDKPLVVREEPAFMSGVSVASISAPGPYDKGRETWYNVHPLDGMEPARAESYLREYNSYILQILNIHEAIPGHYAQLIYNNRAPSIIKAILGNGAMVEGWAVYTERMMLEAGYGNNSPELWLMYYKWNLRTVCNTILDHSVHVLDMNEDQALDLLMRQAFQQEAEARGKYRRAVLTQVQLSSYFTGFADIMQLRDEVRKAEGNAFSLKRFHEEFLSFGSAPVKHVSEMMLSARARKH